MCVCILVEQTEQRVTESHNMLQSEYRDAHIYIEASHFRPKVGMHQHNCVSCCLAQYRCLKIYFMYNWHQILSFGFRNF